MLGSVKFLVYPRVAGAVALAPLWCLAPVTWFLVTSVPSPTDSMLYLGMRGVLAGYMAVGSIPSSQDWYIALKYPLSSFVVLALLVAGFRLAITA